MTKNPHKAVVSLIVPKIITRIKVKKQRTIISLAGESGCGKTETAKALLAELNKHGVNALILGQDNYFYFPPLANDAMRKKSYEWLGPHKEVNMKLLDRTLSGAKKKKNSIYVPYIDYDTNIESIKEIDIKDIKVLIVEGTYSSLLKHIDTRIFIDADYKDTLKFRKLRNRGNEVNDPFVENILETEHKIIAGHKYLADFIITKEYKVVSVK